MLNIRYKNLNRAKVPSLTLLENVDKEWNPDIKHVICIQEPFKNYKTGKIKNTSINQSINQNPLSGLACASINIWYNININSNKNIHTTSLLEIKI